MPSHTYSLQYLLPGELNRDQPQNIQYENVDDTPLGKYLHVLNKYLTETILITKPLASLYCVCVVTSCEQHLCLTHTKTTIAACLGEKGNTRNSHIE